MINEMAHILIVLLVVSSILILFYIMLNKKDMCINKYDDVLEHYDLQIQNITPTECGTQCTEGLNCAGFAYKPIENTCYLSKIFSKNFIFLD